jgi:hypothetical protein
MEMVEFKVDKPHLDKVFLGEIPSKPDPGGSIIKVLGSS